MKNLIVRPAPGLKVRDTNGNHIPENFSEVPNDPYWNRRISVGDVVLQDAEIEKKSDHVEFNQPPENKNNQRGVK